MSLVSLKRFPILSVSDDVSSLDDPEITKGMPSPAVLVSLLTLAANFALMNKNLRCFPRAITVNAALAQAEGIAQFIRHSSNTGYLVDSKSEESVEVRTARIGELLPREWDLSATYLKLDIEGAEYEVLPDMLRSGIRPAVVAVEIHDYVRMHGQRLIDDLLEAGYSVAVEGYGTEGNVCRQIFATRQ